MYCISHIKFHHWEITCHSSSSHFMPNDSQDSAVLEDRSSFTERSNTLWLSSAPDQLYAVRSISLKWERWILGKPRVRYFPSLGFHAYGKPRLANVWFSCSLSYPREGCQPKMWLNSFSVSLSNKFSLFTKQHWAYDCYFGFTLRFRDWFHFWTTSQWLWKDPWNFKYSMNECAFVTFMVRTSHKPHSDQICLPLWLVYSYIIAKTEQKKKKSLYWTIVVTQQMAERFIAFA